MYKLTVNKLPKPISTITMQHNYIIIIITKV